MVVSAHLTAVNQPVRTVLAPAPEHRYVRCSVAEIRRQGAPAS